MTRTPPSPPIVTLDEYQTAARRTLEGGAERSDLRLAILALGVAGEAGEVVDLVKKWIGHNKSRDISAIQKELGDVLWYIAALCSDLGLSLQVVAQMNIDKLLARYPQGFNYADANKPRVEMSPEPKS